jgi:hypothetical protein
LSLLNIGLLKMRVGKECVLQAWKKLR